MNRTFVLLLPVLLLAQAGFGIMQDSRSAAQQLDATTSMSQPQHPSNQVASVQTAASAKPTQVLDRSDGRSLIVDDLVYRPGAHTLRISKPLYRFGVDRIQIFDLSR